MSSLFQVAKLTRPARLRARPDLFTRPSSSSSTPLASPRLALASRRTSRSRPPSATVENTSTLVRKRNESSDFLQAKQLQKERLAPSSSARRDDTHPNQSSRLLPSLRNPNSFNHNARKLASQATKPLPEHGQEQGRVYRAPRPPRNVPSGPSRPRQPAPLPLHEAESSTLSSAIKDEPKPRVLRRNAAGVQLLSPSLHKQLFPGPPLPKPPKPLVKLSTQHLEANGLKADGAATLDEISFDMPPLRGNSIRDHLAAIGHAEAQPYLDMAVNFSIASLPQMPECWATEWPGWTKYNADGTIEAVPDLGDENIVSYDIEVLYKLSPYPVMATAATPNAWYSWLSPSIFEESPETFPPKGPKWDKTVHDCYPHDLIPLFNEKSDPRLVIGHNVGYDRQSVKGEYTLNPTSTRFLDTLSLHVATRGITSVQRPAWHKHKKAKREWQEEQRGLREATIELLREHINPEWADVLAAFESETEPDFTSSGSVSHDEGGVKWEDITSVNSLADVAALHLGIKVDKSVRERFGDEEITHASQLRPELQELLQYCADDVRLTQQVFAVVFPQFLDSCPHPVSFAGALTMGSAILPVDSEWAEYIKNAEEAYSKMEQGVADHLRSLAEKLRLEGPRDGDPWYSQLDWTPKNARWPDSGPDAPEAAVKAVSAARKLLNDNRLREGGEASQKENRNSSLEPAPTQAVAQDPSWFAPFTATPLDLPAKSQSILIPLLLQTTFQGFPVVYTEEDGWCFRVPKTAPADQVADIVSIHGDSVAIGDKAPHLQDWVEEFVLYRLAKPGKPRKQKLLGKSSKPLVAAGLSSPFEDLFLKSIVSESIWEHLPRLAHQLKDLGPESPWGKQLDWTSASKPARRPATGSNARYGTWPAWYYELSRPSSQLEPGELDLNQKKSVTPLLLRMQWDSRPLVISRHFKWLYRVPQADISESQIMKDGSIVGHGKPVSWAWAGMEKGDEALRDDYEHLYFRIPHVQGEGKNVGSPFAKGFVQFLESGKLCSATTGDENDSAAAKAAAEAVKMNVLCSYWISARERIMDQFVVYDSPNSGLILPRVITMGTVTRRAVEATWLTASNAKKNRVGSELKAMVKAPPGYALVGADVDSEELWISSVMGDSQFGMHGATAIGWMTLEGTKSAGTDLHSKTASILGTSRDAAKVFNYSRIYGAGVRHAVQLLMQGDANLTKEEATAKAKALYVATKGEKAVRSKSLGPAERRSLWHGGSESFLFNTLEAIALSDRPTTPALGCGVTKALNRSHLDETSTYLPSRINWVVQSSGVDYLHLLIVSMSYLIKRYGIQARYLISVHDEVRYLVKEEDKYRAALALQIANAWTRALFCFNLGIDDVPQGVTFFSAVDIDHVLRKEVFMPCVTPSHPKEIAPGESLDIDQLLKVTNGGSLGEPTDYNVPFEGHLSTFPPVTLFPDIDSQAHYNFLQAQAERKAFRSRMWLDRQPSSLGPLSEEGGDPTKIGTRRGGGAKRATSSETTGFMVKRLRDATAHLKSDADEEDIRDALTQFEEDNRKVWSRRSKST